MLRSMSSAIAGLRNHQVYMDVVANNISNVNTTGYKASRVNFKDAISQTARGASEATATVGGTNPTQIGLGMTLGGVDTLMTQGSLVNTGKNTDLAIQGEGFFILGQESGGTIAAAHYSRDGAFGLDSRGYLVDRVSGEYVMSADATPAAVLIDPAWGWASFNIGSDGKIIGVMADGTTDTVNQPQIGLAKFPNPEGLMKIGGNMYQSSPNSGTVQYGPPSDAAVGLGSLVPGSLEASNVDLAEQFSRMIMAQRGFQANSRAITASDEMLQDLVNIKR